MAAGLVPLLGFFFSRLTHLTPLGRGVIWNRIPYPTPVIPAKAGIHSANTQKCTIHALDSRLRGNDCGLERPSLANDTATHPCASMTILARSD
jgi:hypothetical protein